jgi:hypothetical protein
MGGSALTIARKTSKNMNIQEYIAEHFSELPKSNFNDTEAVIFQIVRNENYGYGHHIFNGYGVDIHGNVVWCFSSGCSCNGSAGVEHKCGPREVKVFEIEKDLDQFNPEEIDFGALEVHFSDY